MKVKRSLLNPSQIAILELLYKYRFGSRALLGESLGITAGSSLHERLAVLVKHKYVAMRQEKQQKIDRIPAAYFLTTNGMRALAELPGHEYITDSVIKSVYNDKDISPSYMQHVMSIYKHLNAIQRMYPIARVFTKRQMAQYGYFPKQLPDAMLSVPTGTEPKRFFVDMVPDEQLPYQINKRLMNYCDYFDDGGWDVTESELPTLLIIAELDRTERRVQRAAKKVLTSKAMEDLMVLTTTYSALQGFPGGIPIWTKFDEPDELQSLND